jgi:hypothetical protein
MIDKVEGYLGQKTNYALLISGDWGTGKTHYVLNTIKPIVNKTATINDNSKKYKFIYVSLYGIKETEAIEKNIFYQLIFESRKKNGIIRRKRIKLALSAAKPLLRVVLNYLKIGEIDKYIGDFKPICGELVKMEDLVICFDDIERKSDQLSIKSFFGLVNSFVETTNAKIILIANKDKIEKKEFNELKEKTIGTIIEFLPDSRKIVESILNERYKSRYNEYYNFLNDNLDTIIRLNDKNNKNYRNLIFSLDNFLTVFSTVQIKSESKASKIKDYLKEFLRFSIGISIEHMQGKISIKNTMDLDSSDEFLGLRIYSKTKNSPNYVTQFIEKYYENNVPYYFFRSLYNFINGGSQFEFETLLNEVTEIEIRKNTNSKEIQLIEDLSYYNTLKMDLPTYSSQTNRMIEYAVDGKFKVQEYPMIFAYATRFDNPLNLDIPDLVSKLKLGINKAKSISKYDKFTDMETDPPYESQFKDEASKLYEFVKKTNEQLNRIEKRGKIFYYLILARNNFTEFKDLMLGNELHHINQPLLGFCSSIRILNFISNLDLASLHDLASIFKKRYNEVNTSKFASEFEILQELSTNITKLLADKLIDSRKKYFYKVIKSQIDIFLDFVTKSKKINP